MKAIVLSFTLKDQDFHKIVAKVIELKDAGVIPREVLLIHGFLPPAQVEALNLSPNVSNLLELVSRAQVCCWKQDKPQRELMAEIAWVLDAHVIVIGEVKEGVAEEIALYRKRGLDITCYPLIKS